jgi:hypothetical protein
MGTWVLKLIVEETDVLEITLGGGAVGGTMRVVGSSKDFAASPPLEGGLGGGVGLF